ncbi:MAG: tetratricopeptide repeat protein, partial [Candidatus Riflebacteria bacterium]|nr:tetratricopeptide repeat protein [Candidatus Riflebacteria bacterium]
MKALNKVLVSVLCSALCLAAISAEAAKKSEASAGAKKQTTKQAGKKTAKKEKKAEKQKIVPTDSFYDKIWDKFKVGNKADRADVVKTLKKIVKDSPDEYMAYYYLGIMSNEEGQSGPALKYFEYALAGYPKSADINIRMAKILDEKNKKEEANEHYVRALTLDNNNPDALSRVGIMELEKKNYEKAAEYLKKAKELQPDNSATLRALGEVLLEQGNYVDAIKMLNQVLLFDSQDANTHLLLGRAYEKNNNPEKAAEHIELAGKYGKKDAAIVEAIGYDIARNYTRSGKYEEALAAYKKEIKKNDDPALGYYEMGGVYESLEDENNALKAYQKAYELDKKQIQGIFRSAEIYQKRNDKANAEKMLKILKGKADYKEQAAEMLESLKRDEKEKAENELKERLSSKSTKDADLEAAYIESYEANKKDSSIPEKLYIHYKERGYYEEAIKWYRKYAKVGGITAVEKKNVEEDLKSRLEQDNYYLFGDKKEDKPSSSKVASDDLMNLAFNGDNDRQKELALQILASRKDYKEDRKVIEGLVNFYEERG